MLCSQQGGIYTCVRLATLLKNATAKLREWHNRSITSYLPFEGIVVGERQHSLHILKPQNFVEMLSINNNEAFLFGAPRSRC